MNTLIDIAEGRTIDHPLAREMRNVNENPDYRPGEADPYFRIIIPFSAGFDSTFAWRFAVDAGWPVQLVYVDTGAPYTDVEYDRGKAMGADFDVVTLNVDYERFGVIDLGRNALIIWSLAELALERGLWGHIWFGCHGDPGETTITGGDKSFKFIVMVNDYLAKYAVASVSLQAPLIGLTKADMLAIAIRRGWAGYLDMSISCTSPTLAGEHCGDCTSCTMRWLAYRENDRDPGFDLAPGRLDRLWAKRREQHIGVSANAARQQAL
jgi:7-cyano-7-deazaguanine synthase in queuosine biosynthesis